MLNKGLPSQPPVQKPQFQSQQWCSNSAAGRRYTRSTAKARPTLTPHAAAADVTHLYEAPQEAVLIRDGLGQVAAHDASQKLRRDKVDDTQRLEKCSEMECESW